MSASLDLPSFLKRLCPTGNAAILSGCGAGFARYMPLYGIGDTALRIAHFLAQMAEESAGFRTLTEYASGAAYNGRRDLGNTQPGDGPRYKGRSPVQLTGRANYALCGKAIGVDLVNNPEKAAEPDTGSLIACWFWDMRKLNALADRDDVRAITKRINGAYHGLSMRVAYLKKAKSLLTGKTDAEVRADLEAEKKKAEAARAGNAAASGTAGTASAAGSTQVPVDHAAFDWHTLITIGLGVAIVGVVIWFAYRAVRSHKLAAAFDTLAKETQT